MTEFHTPIARVQMVEPHPDKELEHLSIVTILGKKCISGNLEDGSPRYKVGDLVFFCPNNSIIPLEYLKYQGFYWDNEKDRGMLKGSKRNRVGAVSRGSVTSEGILFPLEKDGIVWILSLGKCRETVVLEGDYMEERMGITEFKA